MSQLISVFYSEGLPGSVMDACSLSTIKMLRALRGQTACSGDRKSEGLARVHLTKLGRSRKDYSHWH